MEHRRERSATKFWILTLVLCLFLTGFRTAGARGETITGLFPSIAGNRTISWKYEYQDDFFLCSPDEYHHDLARLSMGLALSAFRDTDHPESQDDRLIPFLESMGFDRIETETYRTNPTADSIGYGIAMKQIGETALIACAVCGGGYGAEWASNLTVDDGVRSAGFQDAAGKVKAALADYLGRHPAGGKARLWITGFSRAAAVSNITAADMTDAGIFEAVYAYTFATPRTTREPRDYPNIYNIIQKDDMVPKVPLADWEYGRYGRDLFMVSVETDFDHLPVIERARDLYREMEGSEMIINTEINYQLRILSDYLLLLFSNPANYAQNLQPLLVNIMAGSDVSGKGEDALPVLLQALQTYSREDTQHQDELRAMLDYLETLLNVYLLRGETETLPADQWNSQLGMTTLFNEHFPAEYLSMLYATDDPGELFTDRMEYIRLVIDGNVEITISDGAQELKTVRADGTEMVNGRADSSSFPDVEVMNGRAVITFPTDRSFDVALRSDRWLPQTVTYTGLVLSNRTMRARLDDVYSFLMRRGETKHITTSVKGKAIETEGSDFSAVSAIVEEIYSPTTAMRLENNNMVKLTVSGFVNKLLFILVILIVQLIAAIILAVLRKKKHRERNAAVTCAWHAVNAMLFGVLELAMWYFIPAFPIARILCGLLACNVIFTYALKGYLIHRENRKALILHTVTLAVFFVLQNLTLGSFTILKGLILLFIYLVFFSASYFLVWYGRPLNDRGRRRAE